MGAILTVLGTLVCAEPQLRGRGTPRPPGSNSRLGDFARGGFQRCATYLIKGQVGLLAWQTVAEGLLRRIAHVKSSRRLWALVARQFVRNKPSLVLYYRTAPF